MGGEAGARGAIRGNISWSTVDGSVWVGPVYATRSSVSLVPGPPGRHSRPVSVFFCGSALPRNDDARRRNQSSPSTCRFLINSFLPVSEFYPRVVTRSGPFRSTEIQQLAANRPSCAVFLFPRVFSAPRCGGNRPATDRRLNKVVKFILSKYILRDVDPFYRFLTKYRMVRIEIIIFQKCFKNFKDGS